MRKYDVRVVVISHMICDSMIVMFSDDSHLLGSFWWDRLNSVPLRLLDLLIMMWMLKMIINGGKTMITYKYTWAGGGKSSVWFWESSVSFSA